LGHGGGKRRSTNLPGVEKRGGEFAREGTSQVVGIRGGELKKK